MAESIEQILRTPGLASFLGARTAVKAGIAPIVMNWKALLGEDLNSGLKLQLEGGLLVDATANHSFTFLKLIGPPGHQTRSLPTQ